MDGMERDHAETGRVLAIAGCTNSGKTTMATALQNMFKEEGSSVSVIHQDDYFLPVDKVEKTARKKDGVNSFYYNYDAISALNVSILAKDVIQARNQCDYVLVEGNMLTEIKEVLELFDRIIFLTLDQATCRRRRSLRKYDPPDVNGYFDDVVWPAYLRHLQRALCEAREDRRYCFLDVSSDSDETDPESVLALIHSFSDDILRICYEPLDIEEATSLVNSPSCGATSVFVGTTRDTFKGRRVIRLDYESYDEMAYKEMRKLCSQVREKFPSVERVVLMHRIGEVPVGEASVIIATASPHRKDAIGATEMAIDSLKASVPIWKKEVYEDGGCSWKENGEWAGGDRKGCENGRISTEEKSFALAKKNRDANRKVYWLRQVVRQMRIS